MDEFLRMGVGVILKRKDKVLLGKRKNSHEAGSWSFPGGKLNLFETIENGAIRETLEETGLHIILARKYRPIFTEDFFLQDQLHYITHYIEAKSIFGEPRVLEPDKCEEWRWYNWDNLPQPLFKPVQNLIKQGYYLFD